MGWYLLRKPYPGLTEEERVDILADEMLFGRGRECSVHCLSMYVSRRHLKLAPRDDGCVYITDLGSSNGTFINQSKITPQVEVPLSVGDEVGIGNVTTDNKDCYVYEVCSTISDSVRLQLQKEEQQQEVIEEPEKKNETKSSSEINFENGHLPERGLKRSANDEPEIVILDDDDGDDYNKHGEVNESVSMSSKRPKLDEQSESVLESGLESMQGDGNQSLHTRETNSRSPDLFPDLLVVEDKIKVPSAKDSAIDSSTTNCTNLKLTTVAEKNCVNIPKTNGPYSEVQKIPNSLDCLSHNGNDQNDEIMLPPPAPSSVNIRPQRHSHEGSFQKPSHRRLSSLMENTIDTSAGTVKMSSPSSGKQSISTSPTCCTPTTLKIIKPEDVQTSTPTVSKIVKPEDVKPVLTSTPCVSKSEGIRTYETGSNADFSPIAKDSSRHSQESSANYTLEEEMIELSDDDEVFPCSQMFAEDDVKPDLQKLEKETNIVDLSLDEEPEVSKERREDELDDVVLISSDEDDDDVEGQKDADRWLIRLSQSSVKSEPKEDDNYQDEPPNKFVSSDSGHIVNGKDNFDCEPDDSPDQDDFDLVAEELEKVLEGEKAGQNAELLTTCEDETEKKKTSMLEELRQEELKVQEVQKRLQTMKERRKKLETEAAEAAAAIKETKEEKGSKGKDKKKDRRDKEKLKEKPIFDTHVKSKDKGQRHRSSDRDKDKPHLSNDTKRKDREEKGHQVKKLKDAFGDSRSDEELEISNSRKGRSLHDSHEKHGKTSGVSSSDTCDPFDMLLKNHNESEHSKAKEREVHVTLQRLEDSHPEWSGRSLSLSGSASSIRQPPPKKGTRKAELVDALPNPPRRAFNRGISENTITKTSCRDRSRSTDDPRDRSRSTDDPKSSKAIDPKALRKEKLAKVAARHASSDRGNAEAKRGAPAKIKVTASNRGSFLTESAESSPASKPRSRRDIVGNMKIPKLKNKPAINLPTKSPLQAMNMSWEKDKPEVNASSATAALSTQHSVTVEIPTGPQPKKRIAQVPHPRFYDDGNAVPASAAIPATTLATTTAATCAVTAATPAATAATPAATAATPAVTAATPAVTGATSAVAAPNLTLQPIKSCLSGSSKHNISLNDSKSVAPKKRVRFKENITEVRYIEKCNNARSVSSLKDADRPKPKPTSQVSMELPVKGPNTPNAENIIQDVIYDICKWNPLWLKEEKDLPPDVLPPVVANMNLPVLPKTEFLDFNEYHKVMYPLLMLELWNGISKEYNSHQRDSRSNMFMAVDSATKAKVDPFPDKSIATLYCHMLVDERNQGDAPRLGNLVVIDLVLIDPSGKLIVNPIFGYVSYDAKDRLRKQDQFHKDLYNHCRNPIFKVRFHLLIRERKNYQFVLDRPMRVKNVKYVRGDLRGFQAMKILDYMPLKYSVISPSAANEDFTLPDVSNKNLVFPEQLNPIQEQIVLQTAEVCQQDSPKICLIQGPPGTGKSHVIASLVVQLLYRDGIYSRANRERGLVPRILLCAPSNNAVDLLVRRLLRRRAVLPKQHRFKMVRVGQPHVMHPDVIGVSLQELARSDVVRQDLAANDPNNISVERTTWAAKLCGLENLITELTDNNKPVPQDVILRRNDTIRRLKVLDDRQKQLSQTSQGPSRQNIAVEREATRKILRGADIVATTLNSCVVKTMETVFPPTSEGRYHFQVCIVDEATQCLEVETLIPLLLGVKTLVLVGDPNQLPATILSKVARDKGLGTSLFARLQKIVPHAVQLLDTQYRMHPEILRWPNKFFYNRRLKTPDLMLSCRDSRVIPYSVLSLPFNQDPVGEVNQDEARFVLQLAELLLEKKAIPQQDFRIGIVAPYQSQRRVIQTMLQDRPCRDMVEVNTIDSYQGQEKDVIILSCVRTNGVGFLSDRQRINVALTRAKYALFICGNYMSLDRDSMWNNLLSDARQRKCFIDIRGHLQNEDLWKYIRRQ